MVYSLNISITEYLSPQVLGSNQSVSSFSPAQKTSGLACAAADAPTPGSLRRRGDVLGDCSTSPCTTESTPLSF